MKRSSMPGRATPLRRTAMPNGAPPLSRSADHTREAKRANQPKRARDTGPSKAVRDLVARRSEGWCEWRGCFLVAAEIHHRLGRKQGSRHGEALERINRPANLLHACRLHHGQATSPFGETRTLVRRTGWLLHEHEDAQAVPVLSRHGWVLLNNEGAFTRTTPPEETS